MKQHYSFLFLLAVSLGSCGKDREDIPLVLEGEYRADNVLLAANPIIMYTRNGRVDNPAAIDGFMKRNQWAGVTGFSRTNVDISSEATFTLAIRADNRATLVSRYQTSYDTIKAEITSKAVNYFVLANADSIGPLLLSNASNPCVQFIQKVKLIYPGEQCKLLSPATGYGKSCKIRPVRIIGVKDRKLFIPQFSWLFKSSGPNSCGYSQLNEWNFFNTAAPAQLSSGDTLVIQERQIALLKQ